MLSYLSANDLRLQPDFDFQAGGLNSTSFGFMILPPFVHSFTKHLGSTKDIHPVLGVCVVGEENGPQWIDPWWSLTLCNSRFWSGVLMQTHSGDVACLSFFFSDWEKITRTKQLEAYSLSEFIGTAHCGGTSSLQELEATRPVKSTVRRQRTRYAYHCSASFLHSAKDPRPENRPTHD